MSRVPPARSDRLRYRATAAGVAGSLALLAWLSPMPPTADHVLLGEPGLAAAAWTAGAVPAMRAVAPAAAGAAPARVAAR